jgi:hypothetical protein|tara:strand:+ start:736 stop:930 length:195 start_codon:yes stop_codon:yes gene_type:complete
MDMMLGIVLMFGIAMIICVGCILANGTQEHIDYMNNSYLKEKEDRSKYRSLDKLEKRIATLEKK